MNERHSVLLTVSGDIPADLTEQVRLRLRPRVDYLELAESFGADLVDYTSSTGANTGRFGRFVNLVAGKNGLLAWQCYRERRRYDVIVTDGEQVGLLLACLFALVPRRKQRPRHLMIVHIMSVRKKSMLFRLLRLGRFIDEMFVYATAQRNFLVESLGYPSNQITLTPFMVDTVFFNPDSVESDRSERTVVSAGLEFRDYDTLNAAAPSIQATIIIAAASPWSRRSDGLGNAPVADNVVINRYDLHALRQVYHDAEVVVMPLQRVEFQAGITTLLEAMAMSKAIVCTRTPGQTDTIQDMKTGVYVEPGAPLALAEAVTSLLNDPGRAAQLGAAARAWAVEHADIDRYVARLAERVDSHRPVPSISSSVKGEAH